MIKGAVECRPKNKKMRELKFRCWDKADKRMFDGWNLDGSTTGFFDGGHFGDLDMQYVQYEGFDAEELGREGWEYRKASEVELMQFTGLRDKNGVELYYDSDLVRLKETWVPDLDAQNKWLWMAVKDDFDIPHFVPAHGAFGVNVPFEKVFMNNRFGFEVVCNVFEHPHLLEANHNG